MSCTLRSISLPYPVQCTSLCISNARTLIGRHANGDDLCFDHSCQRCDTSKSETKAKVRNEFKQVSMDLRQFSSRKWRLGLDCHLNSHCTASLHNQEANMPCKRRHQCIIRENPMNHEAGCSRDIEPASDHSKQVTHVTIGCLMRSSFGAIARNRKAVPSNHI